MWQECKITLQHTRPCYAKSSYRSVDPQTLYENVHQADHVPNGPTNSVVATTLPLRLCGGKPLVAVTRERRYGSSRLRVNDDILTAQCTTAPAGCSSGSFVHFISLVATCIVSVRSLQAVYIVVLDDCNAGRLHIFVVRHVCIHVGI